MEIRVGWRWVKIKEDMINQVLFTRASERSTCFHLQGSLSAFVRRLMIGLGRSPRVGYGRQAPCCPPNRRDRRRQAKSKASRTQNLIGCYTSIHPHPRNLPDSFSPPPQLEEKSQKVCASSWARHTHLSIYIMMPICYTI
jgi:hypothetical protein